MSNLTGLTRNLVFVTSLTMQDNGSGNFYYTDTLDLDGRTIFWFGFSDTWTTAALSAQVSMSETGDADNDYYLKADAGEWSIPSGVAVAGGVVGVQVTDFVGVQNVRFRSGTTGSEVDQASAKTLIVAYG